MAISVSEQQELTCLACGKQFDAEVWELIDGGERPDLVQALLDGTLNQAVCPACGVSNQPQLALLFHDTARRRVYFAVPSGVEEFRWRDQAQTLLHTLVEQLPEEARLPYLGDVQVDQEIAGMRRTLLRRQRARSGGTTPSFGKPIPMPGADVSAFTPGSRPQAPSPSRTTGFNLNDAVEQLLASASPDDLRATVQRFPQLLGDEADLLLHQLAETAFNEGDRDTSTAVHAARTALIELRTGREVRAAAPVGEPVDGAVLEADVMPSLPETAYQALLHTASDAALMEAIRAFPVLLELWADAELLHRTEAALDESNERLATVIEERRDALAELRIMLLDGDALDRAVQALLSACDTDAVERALNEHPTLLTETAQSALLAFADAARSRGDDARAAEADARRIMLQEVRAGLG